jgi:hypothetical protein
MAIARKWQKVKIKCGSGLARDAGGAICLIHRSDTIAGKPAPTKELFLSAKAFLRHDFVTDALSRTQE